MFKRVRLKDALFVTLQGILFLLYLFPFDTGHFPFGGFPGFQRFFGLLGSLGMILVLISLVQLGASLSPFPTPVSTGNLNTTGVFRYVRHPIYSGILLSAYSFALFTDCWFRLLVAIGLHVLFFFKSRYEERLLQDRYPAYFEYMERAGRFIPRIG
jgi:protein-S-isoprenylcysteine O-methyltransferase Ste14